MRNLLGVVLILAGIVGGFYLGFWWAFIGGIVDVVTQIRATNMDATALAYGIAKVLFSGMIGWISACLGIVPGLAILNEGV